MFKKTTIAIIAILFFAFLGLPSQTNAISVTPAVRELTLTPGEPITAAIDLENDGLEAISLTTQVVNFTAKGETGEPQYNIDSAPTGAAIWVDVAEGPINIQPGQKTEVGVTFDTPSNATPGGYYVGVLFNMGETAVADTSEVAIESIIAVPFLVTVKGDYTESGKIAAFSTVGSKTNYTEGPIGFKLRYQNTGDVHLKPTGKVVIKSMFGSEVKSITINEDLGAVLPDSVREFDVSSWKDVGNAFGKYTATVTLTSGTVTSTATVDFWILSSMGIVISVVILIVIILLIVLIIAKAGKKSAPAEPQQ